MGGGRLVSIQVYRLVIIGRNRSGTGHVGWGSAVAVGVTIGVAVAVGVAVTVAVGVIVRVCVGVCVGVGVEAQMR